MTSSDRQDPRPGFEEHSRPHRRWLSRGDLIFSLGVGVVLAVVLIAVLPDLRTHVLGGTEKRETTVVGVHEGTRAGESDRPVTTYDLVWVDASGPVRGTFKRSGPPRRDVGDSWELWVSPDGSVVEGESPLVTWLWLGLGIPATSLVIGLLWQWRQRVLARSIVRGVERHEARLARKTARRAGS